jgi:hypothetical protein
MEIMFTDTLTQGLDNIQRAGYVPVQPAHLLAIER